MAYLNINSLRHKIIDVRDRLNTTPCDILGLSETKLDHTFPDTQFHISGYRLFRKDRNCNGGGLLTYIRSDIPCRRIYTLEKTSKVETIVIEVQPNKRNKLLLIMTYNPPKNSKQIFIEEVSSLLDSAYDTYSKVWIMGDMNFDQLDPTKSEGVKHICDLYNLDQLISEPTNMNIHGQSLIDVVMTSDSRSCKESGAVSVGLSDSHCLIYSVLSTFAPRLPAREVTYRRYKTFNEEDYITEVSRLPPCNFFEDPSDNYWALQHLLRNITDEQAPLKTSKVRAREPPFMNNTLRQAVRHKARLHNRYKRFPTDYHWEAYRKQRNIATRVRKEAIRNLFATKCQGGSTNGDFWRTMKPFLTNKGNGQQSAIMINSDKGLQTNPKDVANELNNFYVNIAASIRGEITAET